MPPTRRVLGVSTAGFVLLGGVGSCSSSPSNAAADAGAPDVAVEAGPIDGAADAGPPSCDAYCIGFQGCAVAVCDLDDASTVTITAFAVTPQEIAWASSAGVIRTSSLDGSNTRTVLTLTSPLPVVALAATTSDVVYSLFASGSPGELHAVDLGTLHDSVLATNLTTLYLAVGPGDTLLGSEVDLDQVVAFALDGGTTVLAGPGQGVAQPSGVAGSAQALYWGSAADGGSLLSLPSGAEAGAPAIPSVVFDGVDSTAVDGTGIYWCADGEVLRADVSGANVTKIVPYGLYPSPISEVAVDTTYVYWAYGNAILRVPKPAP